MNRPSISLALLSAMAGIGMGHSNVLEVQSPRSFGIDPMLIRNARLARQRDEYAPPQSRNNQRQRRKRARHCQR